MAFRLKVAKSQLLNSKPGIYKGTFEVTSQTQSEGVFKLHVEVEVSPFLKITGVGDMPITQRNPKNTGYRQVEDFCVFSVGRAPYSIKASGGSPTGSTYQLTHAGAAAPAANNKTINYQVRLTTNGRRKGFKPAKPNTPFNVPVNIATTDLECDGGENASVRIDIPDANLKRKAAGDYQGVLYLTVGPKI